MCFLWKRQTWPIKICLVIFLNKDYSNHYLPTTPLQKRKKKKNPSIPFASLILKSQKDLKGFLLPYLHAKAKAHPIRFEGIIYSVQSQGLLWKKAQIQKEEKGSNNKPNRARGRGRKKFRSNALKKKKLLYVSFDSLFPDSPYDLFCCEKILMGRKKKISQSIILESKSQLNAFHG